MQFGCTLLAAGAQVGCVAYVSGVIDGAALERREHGHWAGGPRRPTVECEIKGAPSVCSMWLFLHRVLSRSCTCVAVASAKLSFGINAKGDGTFDIAALASLASHPCTIALARDIRNFSAQLFQRQ
jgi:hypothetical protein